MSILSWLSGWWKRRSRNDRPAFGSSRRFHLEQFEQRVVPSAGWPRAPLGEQALVQGEATSAKPDVNLSQPAMRLLSSHDNGESQSNWVIVSTGNGGPNIVRIYTPTGQFLKQFTPFAPSMKGGVRVAAGDMTGDGIPELFCSLGNGGPPVVRIYDGANVYQPTLPLVMIRQLQVYPSGYAAGVNLTVGDVAGDGSLELITAPVYGGEANIRIINPNDGTLIKTISAFPAGNKQGLRIAVGDIDGTGKLEILAARARVSLPIINVLNAETGTVTNSLRVYGNFTNGLFVAAGDANSDGKDEIFASQDAYAYPAVQIWDVSGSTPKLLRQVQAYTPQAVYGTRIWAGALQATVPHAQLVTSQGVDGPNRIKVFNSGNGKLQYAWDAFGPNMKAGLYVFAVPKG
ncbi:MAG: FG-GAP repeat domain-containing protein [Gemmataceae bacterium]